MLSHQVARDDPEIITGWIIWGVGGSGSLLIEVTVMVCY